MAAWAVWLALAILLAVAEIVTLTAVLGLLGGVALITAGGAALGLPPAAQLLVFAIASTVGVLVLRPIARRQARRSRPERFGVEALVGQTAYTVTAVTARGGTVRLGGEAWTARTFDENVVIPAGTPAHVMQIDGATAIVYPQELPWKTPDC